MLQIQANPYVYSHYVQWDLILRKCLALWLRMGSLSDLAVPHQPSLLYAFYATQQHKHVIILSTSNL